MRVLSTLYKSILPFEVVASIKLIVLSPSPEMKVISISPYVVSAVISTCARSTVIEPLLVVLKLAFETKFLM